MQSDQCTSSLHATKQDQTIAPVVDTSDMRKIIGECSSKNASVGDIKTSCSTKYSTKG